MLEFNGHLGGRVQDEELAAKGLLLQPGGQHKHQQQDDGDD